MKHDLFFGGRRVGGYVLARVLADVVEKLGYGLYSFGFRERGVLAEAERKRVLLELPLCAPELGFVLELHTVVALPFAHRARRSRVPLCSLPRLARRVSREVLFYPGIFLIFRQLSSAEERGVLRPRKRLRPHGAS